MATQKFSLRIGSASDVAAADVFERTVRITGEREVGRTSVAMSAGVDWRWRRSR